MSSTTNLIRDLWQLDSWAKRFLLLLSVLYDFRRLMVRYARETFHIDGSVQEVPKQSHEIAKRAKPKVFIVSPTLLLRVTVNSSGYSLLVRAMLDTGCSETHMDSQFARHHIEKVCVSAHHLHLIL